MVWPQDSVLEEVLTCERMPVALVRELLEWPDIRIHTDFKGFSQLRGVWLDPFRVQVQLTFSNHLHHIVRVALTDLIVEHIQYQLGHKMAPFRSHSVRAEVLWIILGLIVDF